MHTLLNLKHWRKIAKLANLGQISNIIPETKTTINICKEPQDYILIHLVTGRPDSKKDVTEYVFSSMGLENVITNGTPLQEEDYDLMLLRNHPEFMNLQKAFMHVMYEKHKNQFFHQTKFYRNHLNKVGEKEVAQIQSEIDKISEQNFNDNTSLTKEQILFKKIDKLIMVCELKAINKDLLDFITELHSENEKK